MPTSLKYLTNYSTDLQQKIQAMIDNKTLSQFLLTKYPNPHEITNDKVLREFVLTIKQQYLKKSSPLSKVIFDKKIHVVNNALGLHSFVSRVQGSKLKSKNEIRVSSVLQKAPEAFLTMIVVHELAHLKEKAHNKAFYQLCEHMLADYHQLEFEMRVFLTCVETFGDLYAE
jgi:predicted metal-dependent hydrolase